MQLMYIVSFILVFMATVVSGARNNADRLEGESGASAMQLSAWHNAAVRRCMASACAPNAVIAVAEIRNFLLPSQSNNPMWTRSAPMVASYHTSDGLVVSFLTQEFEAFGASGRNFATVAAALHAAGKGEHSSHAGRMTPSGFVPLTRRPGQASPALPFSIPAGSYGTTAPIPNGSVVLASRI